MIDIIIVVEDNRDEMRWRVRLVTSGLSAGTCTSSWLALLLSASLMTSMDRSPPSIHCNYPIYDPRIYPETAHSGEANIFTSSEEDNSSKSPAISLIASGRVIQVSRRLWFEELKLLQGHNSHVVSIQ